MHNVTTYYWRIYDLLKCYYLPTKYKSYKRASNRANLLDLDYGGTRFAVYRSERFME